MKSSIKYVGNHITHHNSIACVMSSLVIISPLFTPVSLYVSVNFCNVLSLKAEVILTGILSVMLNNFISIYPIF